MRSGFGAPGICGRCGHGLTGKVKDDITVKPGTKAWGDMLRDPNNFKLFGCMDCGTESTNLTDLTTLTPELELKWALERQKDLEWSIPWYEGEIAKRKDELAKINLKLPELTRRVQETKECEHG